METQRTGLFTLFLTLIFALVLTFAIRSEAAEKSVTFVEVRGTQFFLDGKPYRFLGTNFWYGMNLGIAGVAGDRQRLVRELDRLATLGVTNLRVLGISEGPDSEPWRVVPALQSQSGDFSEEVLVGFDFLLSEMKKRNMKAVVCLSNFWPWSGGLAQYLNWQTKRAIPYPPPAQGGSWFTYQNYTSGFYSNAEAVKQYENAITKLITRTNSLTGVPYVEDPTIMAWQLANEPRGVNNRANFNRWIRSSASLIKRLDKNHLVTTGVEGETPWPIVSGLDLIENHSSKDIDYATVHIWAQNWGWYDPVQAKASLPRAITEMKRYLSAHIEKAKILGKPLVLEEFGISRDENSHDPYSSTSIRDQYYKEVFDVVHREIKANSPLQGVNFWAWSGEGLPAKPYGGFWKLGDALIGDPPHESQGWYGVYATDKSTLDLISDYSRKISN
jgi:mannan endo-1,4-beta-mannosidase